MISLEVGITRIIFLLQFFNFIALPLTVFLLRDIKNVKLYFHLSQVPNQQDASKSGKMGLHLHIIQILVQLNLTLPKGTILLVMSQNRQLSGLVLQ